MSTISKATVVSIKEYGPEVREYILQLEKNHYFETGSFLLLTLEQRTDYTRWPAESRCFSIASQHNDLSTIRLIIRKVGYYTGLIFSQLNPGSQCTVKYAFGDFLLPFFDKQPPICCIAAGTGIAPILGFCENLKTEGRNHQLHVFYSFKNEDEYIGKEILKKSVPAAQLHLFCTRQDLNGTINRRLSPEDIFEYLGDDLNRTHFYICGDESFTKSLKNKLLQKSCHNIYTDEW